MSFFRTIILACLFVGCGEAPKSDKPLVLVSVAPYQYFAERIAGNHLNIQSIVPIGADAHCYEPTPRQREDLLKAKLWFCIGESFEKLLRPLFKNHCLLVDLRNGVNLIEQSQASDLHMWMSPNLARLQAQKMAETFSRAFPMYRDEFATNLAALLIDFDQLDAEIRAALDGTPHRILLVSHPAFGYFCRDYSLEQLSVEFDGKDPRPQQIESLLAQKRPDLAITLPQHNNKGTLIIAEKFHVPVQMIDPYSYHYFETMRTLTKWIATP